MRRWLAALLAMLAFGAGAVPMPQLPVRTLAGDARMLPGALGHAPALLIVGFSRPSRRQTEAWSRQLRESGVAAHLAVYPVAVIGDVPGLLRRMVVSGIRRAVPEALHARFLVAGDDEAAWRVLARAPDDTDEAYLLLVGADHAVRWRGHGPPDTRGRAALQAALSDLVSP